MKQSDATSKMESRKPVESQSQDAARLKTEKPRPDWETRQPAQVTKADVDAARKNPAHVTPPGEMGESQGAAS